ncbi:hypothetical protein Pmani_013357 [Petrolisthes manimaculis]|uniref:Uncharacterized protein n=1 Tax=Petrolisthes manimaculis TaxID=1843537 RepID=A0AAE1UDR8_9EUCA|nr:hypothetical protein Pmani_013357 [Petrolisthes manimaculis]
MWSQLSAQQMRKLSSLVTVVLVSEDVEFLVRMGGWAKENRLLVWRTRLVVVTRLPIPHLQALFSSSWTYSMMNTLVVNVEDSKLISRYK